jgi:hypothetical protein
MVGRKSVLWDKTRVGGRRPTIATKVALFPPWKDVMLKLG